MTRRILLIEDEQLSLDIISALLRGQGYAVDVAVDGFSALEQARRLRYDVALVDYHLPEMDGYTLGRLLRTQHPGGETGPVLIGLTADSNGLAARRGSDAVFQAILPKPIKPAELFATIERLCEVSGPSATETRDAAPHLPDDARTAGAALWRSHGLASPPKAFVSPSPTEEQASALGLCFELVAPEQAQCVILLERHGINEALRKSKRGTSGQLPIIGLSADHADICDHPFRVEDPASWKALATSLAGKATAAVVAFSHAPTKTLPETADQRLHSARSEETLAAELGPRSVTQATVMAHDPATMPELRALLLAGVQTPLDALRRELAAKPDMETEAERRQNWSSQLDSILLATGAIADVMRPVAAKPIEAGEFDPAELAGKALAMIRDSRPPGTTRLSCRSAEGLPARLRGDLHRLSQIVLTLLDDACAGTAPVALNLHLGFDAAQGSLMLRLDNETGEATPEAGGVVAMLRQLRVTLLARLVQLMGGTLSLQAGQILLSVPAERAEASVSSGERGANEPAHVLLVEEGVTSGQLLTLLLTQMGHRVCRTGVDDGTLLASPDGPHDLAIFDLANGGDHRMACLAKLRAFRSAQAEMPAIVLASDLSVEDEAVLRDLGISRILPKPFLPQTLEQAVAACRPRSSDADINLAGPIDATVRDALVGALGEATVAHLTGQLLEEIEALAGANELDAEGGSRLVALAGCASLLGFADMAGHCARPEIATIRAALHRLKDTLEAPRRSAA